MLAFKPLPVLSSLLFTYPATKQSMRNSNAVEVVMLTMWHQILTNCGPKKEQDGVFWTEWPTLACV
jgi:hypothetical protein